MVLSSLSKGVRSFIINYVTCGTTYKQRPLECGKNNALIFLSTKMVQTEARCKTFREQLLLKITDSAKGSPLQYFL